MNFEKRETEHATSKFNGQSMGKLLLSTDTLVGNEVVNTRQENVGEIKDFMLDTHSGRIQYAVLSFGAFLGMGEKLFAVPYSALTLDTENKCFVLDVERERLKSAPGFDKNNWPNMADDMWAKDIHSYYGTANVPDKIPRS